MKNRNRKKERMERSMEMTPVTPWLIAAGLSIPLSLGLYSSGRKLAGLFVGLWTPTLLTASLYNRLLKAASRI